MSATQAADVPEGPPTAAPAVAGASVPFADELARDLASVQGSQEREYVAALARSAARMVLDPAACRAAADTMRLAPGSIERNLDRLALPDGLPLWIEYPHAERMHAYGQSGHGPGADEWPERVACLLAPDPANPEHVAGFVCWRLADGKIMQSYALLHWDMAAVAALAEAWSGDAAGSEKRLLGLADVAIPPGFGAEMELLVGEPGPNSRYEQACIRTERDALGEHVFLLSALLLATSDAVLLEELQAEGAASPQAWMVRLDAASGPVGRWLGARSPGFRAPLLGNGPLQWSQPAETDRGISAGLR